MSDTGDLYTPLTYQGQNLGRNQVIEPIHSSPDAEYANKLIALVSALILLFVLAGFFYIRQRMLRNRKFSRNYADYEEVEHIPLMGYAYNGP